MTPPARPQFRCRRAGSPKDARSSARWTSASHNLPVSDAHRKRRAMATPNSGSPTVTSQAECRSVKDLLKKVTAELARFEAKKLGDLKAELDAFVGQEDALVATYVQKYPQLRDHWCTQHQQIVQLHSALVCAFPKQNWKDLVQSCICTPQHDIHCSETLIAKRKRCGSCARERARDHAERPFNSAKARLHSLTANATAINPEPTADYQLIKEIQALLPQPHQAEDLYL